MRAAALLTLAIAAAAAGAEPFGPSLKALRDPPSSARETSAPVIRFPRASPGAAKTPLPGESGFSIPQSGGERVKLDAARWYVIDFDEELLVDWVSKDDAGEVTIVEKRGPLHLPSGTASGRDADADDPDMVTVKGPFVYIVKAKTKGTVLLEVLPKVKRDKDGKPVPLERKDIVRKTVDVLGGSGPRPPPKPDDPQPSSAPIPAEGLHVLLIYNDKKPVPEDLADVIYGEECRKALDAKCARGSDGRAAYRVWPLATQVVGTNEQLWADAFARDRVGFNPDKGDVWAVISNGKTGFEGRLERTDKDGTARKKFLALLDKYGGK